MHAKSQDPPTHRELTKKLRMFVEQIAAGPVLIADPAKFRRDMQLLQIYTSEELSIELRSMASEVRPEHYVPPPVRKISYEEACKGAPMFDFAWDSIARRERMYLKFAVKAGRCMLLSCHPDAPEPKE
jgi:hypothetical protein